MLEVVEDDVGWCEVGEAEATADAKLSFRGSPPERLATAASESKHANHVYLGRYKYMSDTAFRESGLLSSQCS